MQKWAILFACFMLIEHQERKKKRLWVQERAPTLYGSQIRMKLWLRLIRAAKIASMKGLKFLETCCSVEELQDIQDISPITIMRGNVPTNLKCITKLDHILNKLLVSKNRTNISSKKSYIAFSIRTFILHYQLHKFNWWFKRTAKEVNEH